MPAIFSLVNSVSIYIMPFLYSIGFSLANTTSTSFTLILYSILCFPTT
jgi:hypothetical protein